MSLQGEEPFSGHPKTLRDLSHGLELLSLPATFGAIQLGETFSSCLCVNNEAKFDVQFISLRVEIQTATSKLVLRDIDDSQVLQPGELLETVVTHEMKEIGQHVLCCSVSYRLGHRQEAHTLRKYYKFMVTNPLSVRTKVHVPRSASAVSSFVEREKIFLEVHIQNLTQEPLWIEQLQFLPMDGWKVLDDGSFPGSLTILQSQDITQFVFTLFPVTVSLLPTAHAPGSTIPLGRLDIAWRSSMGEPGRLLTSVLTRRIPPALSQTPTAIPSHLQHRPHSPLSRSSTPPLSLGPPMPFKTRPLSQQTNIRPQSPSQALPAIAASIIDLEVDLVVHDLATAKMKVGQPFEIEFQLTLAGPMPESGSKRLIQVAVQHITPSLTARDPNLGPSHNTPSSPRVSMDSLTRPLIVRPSNEIENQYSPIRKLLDGTHSCFPPPFSSTSASSSLMPLGSSIVRLPLLRLSHSPDDTGRAQTATTFKRDSVKTLFRYQFVALRKGFGSLGSLRVFAVEDRIIREDEEELPLLSDPPRDNNVVRQLKEWDIISDVWVTS